MIVTIHGKSSTNPADSLYAGEPKAIIKDCPIDDIGATVERWLRLGRTVDSITVKWDTMAKETDTGEHHVPNVAQIVAMRLMSGGGQFPVTIEKYRSNGDIIVKRRSTFFLIMDDGEIIGDNSPVI